MTLIWTVQITLIVRTEIASIHASWTIPVHHLPHATLRIIGPSADVHKEWKEIHTGSADPVRSFPCLPACMKLVVTPSISVKKGECDHDPECPNNRACIDNRCLDPCQDPQYSSCGSGAECHTSLHRPICQCLVGWAGNPHEQCFQCMYQLDILCFCFEWIKSTVFAYSKLQMSVSKMRTAHCQRHVFHKNALTHAQGQGVELELTVRSATIGQDAFVNKACKAIRL